MMKPYKCTCGKGFRSSNALISHASAKGDGHSFGNLEPNTSDFDDGRRMAIESIADCMSDGAACAFMEENGYDFF